MVDHEFNIPEIPESAFFLDRETHNFILNFTLTHQHHLFHTFLVSSPNSVQSVELL